MGLEDIEKLSARVAKDPDSKLFLPLAEEYRKEGMFDQAIEVLKKGLDRHPNYVTARVALGKIYLEQGKQDEALSEFENVVASVPDNLFAQKKIAEIYRDKGNIEKAVEHYSTVSYLNPQDEDARQFLEEYASKKPSGEEQQPEEPASLVQEDFQSVEIAQEPEEGVSAEEVEEENIGIDITETAFEAEDTDEIELLSPVEEPDEPVIQVQEEAVQEESAYKDYEEFTEFIDEKIHEDIDLQTEVGGIKETVDESEQEGIFTLPEDESIPSFEELNQLGLEGEDTFSTAVEEDTLLETRDELLSKADALVRDERYFEALELYRELTHKYPDDRVILQKKEELKALMKMLGKDPDVLVDRFENFLNGLKGKRDEFFRNA